jgi:hypothetical protein
MVVVRNSLRTYDEKCNKAISGAVKQMQHTIELSPGRAELKKRFSVN